MVPPEGDRAHDCSPHHQLANKCMPGPQKLFCALVQDFPQLQFGGKNEKDFPRVRVKKELTTRCLSKNIGQNLAEKNLSAE